MKDRIGKATELQVLSAIATEGIKEDTHLDNCETDRKDTLVEFLKKEPKLSAEVRECFVMGDTAALIIDWSIEVPGAPEMTGTGRGFDVLRRNAEGQWRYVITNPFGSL